MVDNISRNSLQVGLKLYLVGMSSFLTKSRNSLQVGLKQTFPVQCNHSQHQSQFLIGRLKTFKNKIKCKNRFWSQFLIGRLKTRNFKIFESYYNICRNSLQVGLKQCLKVNIAVNSSMSQFLIGRLKTKRSSSCIPLQKKSQFLIGRLKTRSFQRTASGVFCSSQFLIGRLKT